MKVLAAEGHKGVPLDPALADLLQNLLKLDARHRLSARDALASPYFRPRPDLIDERVSFRVCTCTVTFFAGSTWRDGSRCTTACRNDGISMARIAFSHGVLRLGCKIVDVASFCMTAFGTIALYRSRGKGRQGTFHPRPPTPTSPSTFPSSCFFVDHRKTQHDAWATLRADLDKVQMGVATPDQLRGTYAAANASTRPPPPPAMRGFAGSSSQPPPPPPRRSAAPERDRSREDRSKKDRSKEDRSREDRNGRDERKGRHGSNEERAGRRSRDPDTGGRDRHGRERDPTSPTSPPPPPPPTTPPPPPPPRDGLHISVQLPLAPGATEDDASQGRSGERDTGGEGVDRARPAGRVKSGSPSPRRGGGGRRRSPAKSKSSRDGKRRDKEGDRERERHRQKDKKRKRDRDRERDRGGMRSRDSNRERRDERSGRDPRRREEGKDERDRWGARGR